METGLSNFLPPSRCKRNDWLKAFEIFILLLQLQMYWPEATNAILLECLIHLTATKTSPLFYRRLVVIFQWFHEPGQMEQWSSETRQRPNHQVIKLWGLADGVSDDLFYFIFLLTTMFCVVCCCLTPPRYPVSPASCSSEHCRCRWIILICNFNGIFVF